MLFLLIAVYLLAICEAECIVSAGELKVQLTNAMVISSNSSVPLHSKQTYYEFDTHLGYPRQWETDNPVRLQIPYPLTWEFPGNPKIVWLQRTGLWCCDTIEWCVEGDNKTITLSLGWWGIEWTLYIGFSYGPGGK